MYTLRPYQQEALDQILAYYSRGINRQVAVLATGLGKTIIFAHLISQRVQSTGKKALILAHREELLLQARDKLLQVNPQLQIGIEQAESMADHSSDQVVIASVATIGRAQSARLAQFNPREYSTVIVDEAHHASAESYKTILRHFGILKSDNNDNKDILLLGVTATPKRNDNAGIETVFDEVSFEYTLLDGINDKWLSNIHAFRVDTSTDISSVRTSVGDFATGELEKAINTPERNKLIVQTYKDLALGKQTLVFAVDVAHTHDLFQTFSHAGISSAYVTGETPKETRQELLSKFANKEIHVMVNAMVLTEGYDNAGIECIFMARPTQSGILYQQMIGRGTRLHPGKSFLTIVDFVDNTSTNSLQTASSLLGFDGAIDFAGEDILQAKPQIEALLEKRPFYDLNKLHVKKIPYELQEIDILQQQTKEKQETLYTWHKFGEKMRMRQGKTTYYEVGQSITGQYILKEHFTLVGVKKQLGEFDTQAEAIRYADSLIAKSFAASLPGPSVPNSQTERWEQDLPSEAQISLLRSLGVDEQTILFLNKGEASRLISERKRSRG